MVSVRGKHFYIFEPVVVLGPNMPVMIPVFFYTKNNIIYAKCVTPQIVNLASPKEGRSYTAITLPGNIDFNSPILTEVDVDNFSETFAEIKMPDGSLLADRCKGHLVGRCSF